MTMRIAFYGAAVALCLATVPAWAENAPVLPAGEGREVVATACTQCHTAAPFLSMRNGPAGWSKHVSNMMLRGAQITPPDAETVLQYLNTNLGPGQSLPPAKPITLVPGTGKDLVETRCMLCHDLERITTKRQKREWPSIVANMFERFGYSAPDEAIAISSYLAANYGSD